MRYLVIGSGGREHAIAWKLAQGEKCEKIFVTPGNGGTAIEDKCLNVSLDSWDDMIKFSKDENIDMAIVGPEEPLVKGIIDRFNSAGIKAIGADMKSAMLEGSKVYAKKFMNKYNIRTAGYEEFNDIDEAFEYCKKKTYPLVVKADGLAQGKGVTICESYEGAKIALLESIVEGRFSDAGKRVLIEDFVSGVEASIITIFDGERITPLISCMDHKKIGNGNTGPNTGGMGIVAPNPFVTDKIFKDFEDNIMAPTLEGLKGEGMNFKGFIFFGIMIRDGKSHLLEYNMRLGDPETQAIMSLMNCELGEVLQKAFDGNLQELDLKWHEKHCCGVVVSSGGYPASYKKGYKISSADGVKNTGVKGFYAGAQLKDGELVTSGGRVVCVTSLGDSREEAIKGAYLGVDDFTFRDMYHRDDIGQLI